MTRGLASIREHASTTRQSETIGRHRRHFSRKPLRTHDRDEATLRFCCNRGVDENDDRGDYADRDVQSERAIAIDRGSRLLDGVFYLTAERMLAKHVIPGNPSIAEMVARLKAITLPYDWKVDKLRTDS